MKAIRLQAEFPGPASENDAEVVEPGENRRKPGLWRQLVLLLWVEAVVAAYFWVHKPWPMTQMQAPLTALLDVALAFVLAALAGGIGRFILPSWSSCSKLEMAALQLALGMGGLSVGVLTVGLLGWLSPGLAWIAVALGIVVFRKQIRGWLHAWPAMWDGFGAFDHVERLAFFVTIWLICLNALQALAPPLKWDSLVYHLELPRRYLEQGGIYYLSDNLFGGQPQLAEMMFTWAMALRSGSTAALLGWAVGVAAVTGVAGFAGRLLGRRVKWIAAAILLSGASISRGLGWAYVDLWVLLFGLSATVVLVQRENGRSFVRVLLAGVFTGLAISTKYSAAVLLPIGALLLVYGWLTGAGNAEREPSHVAPDARDTSNGVADRHRSSLRLVGDLAAFGVAALLTASPWLLKNYSFTGNPVYPYFFQGRDMDALRQTFYAGESPQLSVLDAMLLPIKATIFGIEGGPVFNTSISLLILAFLPFVWLGWRTFRKDQRSTLGKLVLVALTAWLLWGVGSHIALALNRSRHYYAAFPALAVLATAGYQIGARFDTAKIRTGWIFRALVLLVLILTGVGETLYFAGTNPLRVLAGVESEEQFLAGQLGWFGPAMEAINHLPSDSRVYFLWEPRAYYCQIECSPDVILDRWWHLQRTVKGADRIAASIRAQGFTHVLIYDLGVELERESRNVYTPSDWQELDKLKAAELFLISSFGDAYSLYATKAIIPGKEEANMTGNEDWMSHE